MLIDINSVDNRVPSFWNEGQEATMVDLEGPAAVDLDFNRVDDWMAFWRGEEREIELEHWQPSSMGPQFCDWPKGEVFGLKGNDDATHSESAFAANQPDAYSELTDSDF